jgi:DNA-binding GntR family transcriptional regulator
MKDRSTPDDDHGKLVRMGIAALGDVPRRTAYEEVLDRLRRAILGGVLAPGTPLILSELSARLGVSQTPVREAIRDLASEGLVDFDAYRSSTVHTPTLEEAQEVYELRITLEPIAVRRSVPRISEPALEKAREMQQLMAETDDVARWVEMNREFHALLTAPAGSPRLLSIIAGLRNAAAVQVATSIRARPEQLDHGNEDHASILAAYARRDAAAAVELTKAHLGSTLRAIEAYERASSTAA